MGLSPLKEHKYRHNFNTENNQCPYADGIEDTVHFFLICKKFYDKRKVLFNTIYKVSGLNLLSMQRTKAVALLLYGETTLDSEVNKNILLATIEYIKTTERLSAP